MRHRPAAGHEPVGHLHQLQVLKKSKLVKYRRKGKTVFYSLADSHVRTILGQGMEHVTE